MAAAAGDLVVHAFTLHRLLARSGFDKSLLEHPLNFISSFQGSSHSTYLKTLERQLHIQ